jgi:hypothetical protein
VQPGRIEAALCGLQEEERGLFMPNWTSNEIHVGGDASAIREFLNFMRGDADQRFDFRKIIPMPELLRHTASGFHKFEEHRTWYVINPDLSFGEPGYDKNERPFTPEEKTALTEIGADSWYDWRLNNWGTKWNACQVEIDDTSETDGAVDIGFDTAWSAPFPVFEAIAAKFQNLTFEFRWTDEGEQVTHSMVVRRGEGGAQ